VTKIAANGALFMKRAPLIVLLAVGLFAALFATACGSESTTVGANDVAVVGDEPISKEQFDELLDRARDNYEKNKQEFPAAGTAQYVALRRQAMQFLVQRAQFEQKARELGLEIKDSDVDKQMLTIKSQYFGKDGKCDSACETKYAAEIKKQGVTDEQVREDVRASVVQNKIYETVTKDVTVSDKDVEAYYKKNKQNYVQPASRDVRHILVKKKAVADSLYQRVTNGESFAALAKKFSEDPSSKAQGGKLPISKGRQVPEFDKAAFALDVGEISRPVKTTYGWHIITALTPIKKQKTTPLSEVRPAIRQQLLQQEKTNAMKEWVEETQKNFEEKTTYQVGYEPPASTNATSTTR
jgi:parvulin-like peptidyl-prolyl isomerase